MKRFLTLLALPLALAACGSTQVSYRLAYDTTDAVMVSNLTDMSARVIDRRLANLEEEALQKDILASTTGSTIKVTVKNQEIADILTQQLTQPFTVSIMKQVPEGQGRLKVEGHGEFADTGIEQDDLVWGEAAEDNAGKGVINLIFSPEGKAELAELIKNNIGNSIGIFVRDRLISKLTVKTDTIDENILIRDIPSAELARVFVEDLNVGLHVTFTPLP